LRNSPPRAFLLPVLSQYLSQLQDTVLTVRNLRVS
jgi:hypothetical protein